MKKHDDCMNARELLTDMNAFLLEPRDCFLNWEQVAKRIEDGITYGHLTPWHLAAIGMAYSSDTGVAPDRDAAPCHAVVSYCNSIVKQTEDFE